MSEKTKIHLLNWKSDPVCGFKVQTESIAGTDWVGTADLRHVTCEECLKILDDAKSEE